jgi:hypothetical protein
VCPKIPAGAPPDSLYAVEWEPWMTAVYRFYRECRAVGEFPRDPLVKHFAALIRSAEDAADAARSQRVGMAVIGSLLKGG